MFFFQNVILAPIKIENMERMEEEQTIIKKKKKRKIFSKFWIPYPQKDELIFRSPIPLNGCSHQGTQT